MSKREFGLTRRSVDPFALLRQMTSEFDRMFEQSAWPGFRWPAFRDQPVATAAAWYPQVDVFEKDNRLVTRVDLPGLKKEDVKVEIADGQLTITGERKAEAEEKKENFYRCEREYGSFYRAVPLPEGVKADEVHATFTNGVLEVTVPLPMKAEAKPQRIEVQEPAKAIKAA
jgi:HSP20 family protein